MADLYGIKLEKKADTSDKTEDEHEEKPKEEEKKVTPEKIGETTEDEDTKEDDDPEAKKDDTEAEDNANTPKVYKIGGQEFTDPEEAIIRAASVYGDNSRMAGELKQYEQTIEEKDEALSELQEKVKILEQQNADWKKFQDGEGDEPKADPSNVVDEVLKKLKQEKEVESIKQRKEQYADQIKDLQKKPDFALAQNEMIRILDKYFKGDVDSISPNELYELARGKMKEDEPSIQEAVKELERKNQSKESAKKIVGGSSKKTSTIKPYADLSPEMADYYKSQGLIE
jgi:hypothetical protein